MEGNHICYFRWNSGYVVGVDRENDNSSKSVCLIINKIIYSSQVSAESFPTSVGTLSKEFPPRLISTSIPPHIGCEIKQEQVLEIANLGGKRGQPVHSNPHIEKITIFSQ